MHHLARVKSSLASAYDELLQLGERKLAQVAQTLLRSQSAAVIRRVGQIGCFVHGSKFRRNGARYGERPTTRRSRFNPRDAALADLDDAMLPGNKPEIYIAHRVAVDAHRALPHQAPRLVGGSGEAELLE